MHIFDAGRRFYGGYAIVGGGLPIALGLALADKMRGNRRVTACFFGEGAAAEGEFHESLNLAELWHLPVVFLCENNRYAMGTAIHRALAQTEIWRFAETYGIPGEPVDGMDVLAVREVVGRAIERARRDKTPALVEARTYRFRGHSMRDPAGSVYRTKEEVEREKLRDPITLFGDRCLKEGVLTEADLKNVEKAVNDLADEAVAFAEASPEPPADELFTDVIELHGDRAFGDDERHRHAAARDPLRASTPTTTSVTTICASTRGARAAGCRARSSSGPGSAAEKKVTFARLNMTIAARSVRLPRNTRQHAMP